MIDAKSIYTDLQTIRAVAPLIHNITNFVMMNYTANVILATGALPVMAHALEEIEDMVQLSRAIVINMGTLDKDWVMRMKLGLEMAIKYDVPRVFDPVGAGATFYRSQMADELLQAGKPMVIRGNASEIMALANEVHSTRGVESTESSLNAVNAMHYLAKKHSGIVVVSGATDIICSTTKEARITNGVPLMSKVVGLGCSASALVATFCAVNSDLYSASVHAMATLGIAGEIAAEKAQGPGTFAPLLLDALYHINERDITRRLKISETVLQKSEAALN